MSQRINLWQLRVVIITFFITIAFHLNSTAQTASDEMPIIAYMGVPDWRTSEADFKVLSECGFTVSLYPYASLDLLVKACRYADKYGVKVLGHCADMLDNPTKAARTLKNEPGFFGYFLQDEPSMPELQELDRTILRLKAIDSSHPFYVNLLPYYEPEWVEPTTKVKNYQEYLKAGVRISNQQISFDYYPVTTEGVRKTWYENLEMVRQESLLTGKPFWGFVLSVPHASYPQPTQGSLRLQIYTNLAYGAQAIQYFTYWNPGDNEGFDFHDAPILRNGQKSKNYGLVQKMNQELRPIASLFHGASVVSVHQLGKIANGATRLSTAPTNISSIKINSRQGAVISQFKKNGHLYMAIVNKDHQNKMSLKIKAKNATLRHITKQLKEETVKTSYNIAGGDILLFRLQ